MKIGINMVIKMVSVRCVMVEGGRVGLGGFMGVLGLIGVFIFLLFVVFDFIRIGNFGLVVECGIGVRRFFEYLFVLCSIVLFRVMRLFVVVKKCVLFGVM